jgi:hypothetical protein
MLGDIAITTITLKPSLPLLGNFGRKCNFFDIKAFEVNYHDRSNFLSLVYTTNFISSNDFDGLHM